MSTHQWLGKLHTACKCASGHNWINASHSCGCGGSSSKSGSGAAKFGTKRSRPRISSTAGSISCPALTQRREQVGSLLRGPNVSRGMTSLTRFAKCRSAARGTSDGPGRSEASASSLFGSRGEKLVIGRALATRVLSQPIAAVTVASHASGWPTRLGAGHARVRSSLTSDNAAPLVSKMRHLPATSSRRGTRRAQTLMPEYGCSGLPWTLNPHRSLNWNRTTQRPRIGFGRTAGACTAGS